MIQPGTMKGRVTTLISSYGDLLINNAEKDTDWERLESLPEDDALAELLEYQTSNGFEWLRSEEIGALTSAPILGWNVFRDDAGRFEDADEIYWFEDYQVTDALKVLKAGETLIFKRALCTPVPELIPLDRGPWKADKGQIRDRKGNALGSYPWGAIADHTDRNNGELMAASRELLDACIFTLTVLENLTTDDFSKGGDRPARERLKKVIRPFMKKEI